MDLHKGGKVFFCFPVVSFPKQLFLSASVCSAVTLSRTGFCSPPQSLHYQFPRRPVSLVFFMLTEHEHPGGGHKDPCHPRHLPQAGACHRGLRGGEGRRDLEADLRQALDYEKFPSCLWHVWISEREEIQHQRLQVRAELCMRHKRVSLNTWGLVQKCKLSNDTGDLEVEKPPTASFLQIRFSFCVNI